MAHKKILIITSGYPNISKPYSGIFIKRQIDILQASGEYDFDVLTTGDSRKGVYSFVKYARLISKVLIYSLVHRDFDMIHAHEVFPAGLLGLIPKILRTKKLIITLHGGPLYTFERRSVLLKWTIYFTLRNADKLIYVSRHLHDQVIGLFNISEETKGSAIINMGVALDEFHPVPKYEARVRLGLDFIDPNKKMVMFAGRLVKLKGGLYLVRAASILKDRGVLNKICILFVGAGPEEEVLKSEAARLGVHQNIYFMGAKRPEEICLWMSAADILTVTSLEEGFGLVALEAMACGTPIISTDRGGLKEFIKHNENGLVIKAEDACELAEGIVTLLGGPHLRRKFVRNGLLVAEQNSAKRQALRVEEIYRNLIMGGAN